MGPGAVSILLLASAAAGSNHTDFGVRTVVPSASSHAASALTASAFGRTSLASAVALARAWGQVTSTIRSVQHNRDVGGVANSFHLSGRAIDIARRPGVTHAEIAAAYRRAGYRLVESLDEGDHSHFAFSFGPARVAPPTSVQQTADATEWRIVTAPAAN